MTALTWEDSKAKIKGAPWTALSSGLKHQSQKVGTALVTTFSKNPGWTAVGVFGIALALDLWFNSGRILVAICFFVSQLLGVN